MGKSDSLNYSMLCREMGFSRWNGEQGKRKYEVKDFRVVRRILSGM